MHRSIILVALCGVTACVAPAPPLETPDAPTIEVTRGTGAPPRAAHPDACYEHQIVPAAIETGEGSLRLRPGTRIPGNHGGLITGGTETWFETPCPAEVTEDFIASLQRALAARQLYTGTVTGQMDPATRAAIRAYQRPLGLDSGVLSRDAARQLGLVIWDPELAAAPAD